MVMTLAKHVAHDHHDKISSKTRDRTAHIANERNQ